jgi:ElaB/YqjD/DUF883 family membrane-anchored ribosome-binding protein
MENNPKDFDFEPDFNIDDAPGWENYTDENGLVKRRKRSLADVKDGLKKIGDKIGQSVVKTGQKIGQFVDKATETIENVVEKTGETFGKAVEKVGKKVEHEIGQVKGFVEEKTRDKREFDAAVQRELEYMRQNNEEPMPKSQEWQDLSTEAFHKKYMEDHTPLTEEQKIVHIMTPSMKEAYSEAEECLKNGQDSIAAQYYQIILNEAMQGEYPKIQEFIHQKLKKIY